MSYDINLEKVPEGTSLSAAEMAQLADELCAAVPGIVPDTFDEDGKPSTDLSAQDPASRFYSIELVQQLSPRDGFGIHIYSDSIAISLPYWHDTDKAKAIFDTIARCGTFFTSRGYKAFDSQISAEEISFDTDVPLMLEVYLQMVGEIPGAIQEPSDDFQYKPWWKFW